MRIRPAPDRTRSMKFVGAGLKPAPTRPQSNRHPGHARPRIAKPQSGLRDYVLLVYFFSLSTVLAMRKQSTPTGMPQ
jgi:hypothetical protein